MFVQTFYFWLIFLVGFCQKLNLLFQISPFILNLIDLKLALLDYLEIFTFSSLQFLNLWVSLCKQSFPLRFDFLATFPLLNDQIIEFFIFYDCLSFILLEVFTLLGTLQLQLFSLSLTRIQFSIHMRGSLL
jgi:hypothetical protein